ncbi:type VI secretion system baseplate subunit TssF [Paraburkholderia sp. Ac-20340]|uniref:type VI secretion system baseplate subunit TssF n=1 Tax=Paraburkholderia sp. Ac-20340 TaxID=2703888 RepID=UPI00197E1265|nr:type VI secretion system baseplate subunit TssF [Paraburkholderia sp. Ac-20340]MBN3854820.1 type VI secretion system baseplate subunit TssF [Paraburkholderia sp. Ac-20340]
MDEFEKLLPYFERELAQFRHDLLQFEHTFPKTAARLSMSGGQSDDPHVERILQSAAWLNARASRRIVDQYSESSRALIESVFPAYLQPIPACSIARFAAGHLFDGLTSTFVIASDTELEHHASLCKFRTTWDVTLAPLAITRAQFSPPTQAPTLRAGLLSSDAAGIVSIEFAAPGHKLRAGSTLFPQTLRIYLHADRTLSAALIDTFLLRPHRAFVEANGSRAWLALDAHPCAPVGFDDAHALLAEPANTQQPALRMLIEYATFAHKFGFVDVDLEALLRRAGPCDRLTVHFPVAAHIAHPVTLERLGQLNAAHLQLFCTPVINVFQCEAKPVDVVADTSVYLLCVPDTQAPSVVIHSVDSVRLISDERGTPSAQIPPYRSLRHWTPLNVFWSLKQADPGARLTTSNETAIQLVNADGQPVTPAARRLAVGLTCTNGTAPSGIRIGATAGDLESETQNIGGPITMLVTPSASAQPPTDDRALWRLISTLSPNHVSIARTGLNELRELLYQLAKPASPDNVRYVAGITALSARPVKRAMHVDPLPTPTLVPGMRITLTIDETAFVGHAIYTFARLMERFFLRYAGWDCMELSIVSEQGAELYCGEPQLGAPELAFV